MDILQTIVLHKQRELRAWPPDTVTTDRLRAALNRRGGPRDFCGALRQPRRGPIALIAEVKQASPSAGLICPHFDPVRIAQAYARAGAACLSVLTEDKFFQGSLAHLRDIRAAVDLPLLRKDFIIDERQLLESVEWGADAILLIVAVLDDERLRRFHRLAADAGLTVLVEVHNESELDRALKADARLIGVNNRDLKTFTVDLATTERMARRIPGLSAPGPPISTRHRLDDPRQNRSPNPPASRLLVAESGIRTRADVARMSLCGAHAILVGESLVRHSDLEARVAELLSEGNP